jgi:hypothetical protein
MEHLTFLARYLIEKEFRDLERKGTLRFSEYVSSPAFTVKGKSINCIGINVTVKHCDMLLEGSTMTNVAP